MKRPTHYPAGSGGYTTSTRVGGLTPAKWLRQYMPDILRGRDDLTKHRMKYIREIVVDGEWTPENLIATLAAEDKEYLVGKLDREAPWWASPRPTSAGRST